MAILGAGGFIGARATELLERQSAYEIVPVTRKPTGLKFSGRLEKRRKLADAFDQAAMTAAFADCDTVLSAIAGDPHTITDTIDPIYAAADAAGVRRIVYLSSAVVHGHSPAPGTDERSDLTLNQPLDYNRAKILAERRLHELRERGKVEVVILRPGIVYGPRSQWTQRLAEHLRTRRGILAEGDVGICNAIFVDNLVHAIDRAISVKEADGEVFLLNDREIVTWRDMIEPIAKTVGVEIDSLPKLSSASGLRVRRPRRKQLPRRISRLLAKIRKAFRAPAPDLPSDFDYEMALLQSCRVRLPTDKADRMLGFSPPVSFAEGSRRSVAWLRRTICGPKMTADSCDVAVVIPTYDHAHFLEAAIESALNQQPKPREIVVVDDGSADHPEEVTKRFPEVRIVRQRNAGLAAARNRGLSETSSPNVVFLDADDRLITGALAAGLTSLAEDDSAAFTYGKYEIVIAATGERRSAVNTSVPKQAFPHFLRQNCIGMHGAVMYRRSAIESVGGFREHLRTSEDYDLYLRLSRDWPVLHHEAYCAEYWQHDSNMSRDPALMLRCGLTMLRDYEGDAMARGLIADYRAGLHARKRFYVDKWVQLAKESLLSGFAKAPAMVAAAPREMAQTLGNFLLARIR